MLAFTYPMDHFLCMTKDGPTDSRFWIPGGTLLYNAERDMRFPYIYKLDTHALVHSTEYMPDASRMKVEDRVNQQS